MDGDRFDAIARTLIAAAGRRRTLGGLIGGTLAVLGLAGPDDAWSAKSGKCKPKCGECEKCDKGKCRKTKDGKKRCKKGKCKPQQATCPPGQVRVPVTNCCCLPPGQNCAPLGANATCCSGTCVNPNAGRAPICAGFQQGAACQFGAQCLSGVCSNGICT